MSTPDPHDDEIISAVIDGDATPAERALVEGSPELTARAETFRAARAGLLVPDDDEVDRGREERLATAMQAWPSDSAAPTDPGVMITDVTDLASAGSSGRRRLIARLGAVAAATVLLAIGVVAVQSQNGPSNRTSTASEAAPGTATSTIAPPGPLSDRATAAPEQRGVAAEGTPADGTLTDLGTFPTVEALRAAVGPPTEGNTGPPPAATSDTATAVPESNCAPTLATLAAAPIGSASVAGRPVIVARGAATIVVLALSTCEPVP